MPKASAVKQTAVKQTAVPAQPPTTGLSGILKQAATGDETKAPADILQLVQQGWTYREAKEVADAALKATNTALLEAVGVGYTITVNGLCSAGLTERETAKVTDPDTLRQVLGSRFEDLVVTTVSYKPTDKLFEIVSDPDHLLREHVLDCITFDVSQTVTYRPVKAK